MFHIIMGDFNAKVGRLTTQREPCISQHGVGTRNERGLMLVDFTISTPSEDQKHVSDENNMGFGNWIVV